MPRSRPATGRLLVAVLAVTAACRSTASDAPSSSVAPPAPVVPAAGRDASSAPRKNTVRWSTASEVDNFGYDVYRGDTPDGPFVRITPRPIQGAGTSDETHRYVFVDEDIDPRRSYYYFVESIDLRGVRQRFTPVIEAPPKLPPPATPSGETASPPPRPQPTSDPPKAKKSSSRPPVATAAQVAGRGMGRPPLTAQATAAPA